MGKKKRKIKHIFSQFLQDTVECLTQIDKIDRYLLISEENFRAGVKSLPFNHFQM